MSTLSIQFLDQGLHRVMFDAIPIPMFVVDGDVTILEYNSAAARLVGSSRAGVLKKRGGEVLHCLHSTETGGGCGASPSCSDCVVRNSVESAWRGIPVVRESAQMEIVHGDDHLKFDVKVSTNPFKYERHAFVLLMLEGLERAALAA